MPKNVTFTRHAEWKIKLLAFHGFKVSKHDIENILNSPDRVRSGYHGRRIADKVFTQRHWLCIVFEEYSEERRVITLYPARRDRYEN